MDNCISKMHYSTRSIQYKCGKTASLNGLGISSDTTLQGQIQFGNLIKQCFADYYNYSIQQGTFEHLFSAFCPRITR